MIESSVRWILAFVAALVAVILVAPLAAAATPGAPSGASLTCDSHGATATAVVTAAERGPPAGLYQYTTYDAVDRRSDGASVRPDRATPSAAITYTHHTPLVQVAGAAAMTQEQAGVSDGCSAVFDRGGVAANGATRLQVQIGTKIEKQMGKRGWTRDSVEDLINNPARTVRTRDTRHLPGGGRNDAPATAYINRGGGYVVRNDETGDIVQVSNLNDPNWKSPW